MSDVRPETSRPVVLRQRGVMLVPVAVWVFCALSFADAVVEGSTGYAVRVAVLMAAIAFGTWLLLASPCLVVEAEGLRVVNPVRTHWVPFGALVEVSVRGLTTVTARRSSGRPRSITSWNGPGLPRHRVTGSDPVDGMIDRARVSWERRVPPQGPGHGDAVLTTAWRWRSVLVLLTLVIANVAIWLR